MKKNNKGFTILETLITSTLIISTLVFLYVQFSNLKKNYQESFEFNTVRGIHKAKELAKFYKNNKSLRCTFSSTTPCVNNADTDEEYQIFNVLKLSNSILMSDYSDYNIDYTSVSSVCDENCQKFANKVRTNTTYARLVVIYSDGTYASVLIK